MAAWISAALLTLATFFLALAAGVPPPVAFGAGFVVGVAAANAASMIRDRL